jgi:hypothetical protein
MDDSKPEEIAMGDASGETFDRECYATHCGALPYNHSCGLWAEFFGRIADELIRSFRPQRVFDAGCANGFLVESFWDRGWKHGVATSPDTPTPTSAPTSVSDARSAP